MLVLASLKKLRDLSLSYQGEKRRKERERESLEDLASKLPNTSTSISLFQFHRFIRRAANEEEKVEPLGQYTPSTYHANMDQTTLPFRFSDGEMYANVGERCVGVWRCLRNSNAQFK